MSSRCAEVAAIAAGLRKIADALDYLAVEPASSLRLVPAEPIALLTVDEAAALLKVSKASVQRLARRNPRVLRRVGQRGVRYDRAALLAALPRGI